MDQKGVALDALEKAIRIEKDGRRFYLQAAAGTRDQRGKEIFLSLAQAEEEHLRIVEKQYDSLSEGTGEVDLGRPLFPPGREALEKMVRSGDSDLEPWVLRTTVTNSTGKVTQKPTILRERRCMSTWPIWSGNILRP